MPDQDKNGVPSDASASSDSGKTRPSSFSGMPGQSSNQTQTKNLITLGICLVIAVGALLLMNFLKRRK